MSAPLWLAIPFRALLRNKTRTFLAMLGIVIGIASVIAMIAIGQGASLLIEERVRSLGSNMIMLMPGAQSSGGVSMGGGTRVTLTSADARAIQEQVPGVKAVSPVVQARGQIVFGDKNWAPRSIRGEGEDYLEVKDWGLLEGEFFGADDVQAARRVCVIGTTILQNLFEDESPVGQTVRIQNMPFRIVGVLEPKGTSPGGEDQDDVVILPWTTVKRVLQGSRFDNLDVVLISSAEPESIPEVEREVTALLHERHALAPDQPEDFRMLSMEDMIRAATESTRVMTTMLALIASISLVVGGVGIMNIMLVSVSERTREIGLRMAVGARPSDILSQFLCEALLMALAAGALGILLGVGATLGLGRVMHWPVHLSPSSVAVALLSSTAVGLVSGLYPSSRASHLDPIVALRSD